MNGSATPIPPRAGQSDATPAPTPLPAPSLEDSAVADLQAMLTQLDIAMGCVDTEAHPSAYEALDIAHRALTRALDELLS